MRFIFLYVSALMTFSILCAEGEVNSLKKSDCACVSCACTAEAHCGCYSGKGCRCAPGVQCACTEKGSAVDKE